MTPISQKEQIVLIRLNTLLDIKDFETKKNAADSLLSDKNVIGGKESFIDLLNYFFIALDSSDTEKEKRIAKITTYFDKIVCALDTGQQDKFYSILNNGTLFVTITGVLEKEPVEHLDYIITHLKIFLNNN